MDVTEFDFTLPESLIALEPASRRDASRLLVLHRQSGKVEHRSFSDLAEYLGPEDMLVLNNTKVLPCRLQGLRTDGRALDMLLVRELEGGAWEVLSRGGYTGELVISEALTATLESGRMARLSLKGAALMQELQCSGQMPLPPYIRRKPHEGDRVRYQTVYAEVEGSIAAPTAGLHFTPELLSGLRDKGVRVRHITLHVGRGTFMPIRVDRVEDHRMLPECFEVRQELIEEMKAVKGRRVGVGTTVTRTLESLAHRAYEPLASDHDVLRGSTELFINPGHEFLAIDALLTNFHLPRSTPLMLASAFAGRENLLCAYQEALGMSYRFFSYGDAMLVI